MLEIKNVYKTFNPGTVNQKVALNDLNLTLEDGDFVTVIGGNGAGKSTMLNAVAGVWPVDMGKIIIDGKDITRLPEHKRAAYIGRVFQDPENDAARYEMHSETLKKAFNEKFLVVKKDTSLTMATSHHTDSVYYGNNTITANILPLAFDMVPEPYKDDVEKQVIATTSHNAHVSCGNVNIGCPPPFS